MTFEEWFAEQYPNADLSESSLVAVKDKMHGAWCAALEWGTRPTSHNSAMLEIALCLKAFMFVWDAEEGYGGIANLQDRIDAVVAQLQQ